LAQRRAGKILVVSDLDRPVDPGQDCRILRHCQIGKMFDSRIAQKDTLDLSGIFNEGYTWPSLEVIRFWWQTVLPTLQI